MAAAVALSNGDHKRRIAGFLSSANGLEIPDEEGHRWLGRLQDDGRIRLEESWNGGGYREHFVSVADLETLAVGVEEDPFSDFDGELGEDEGLVEEPVAGIAVEKVHGLTVLVNRLQEELEAKESLTPELKEEIDTWFLGLEEAELESLVAAGLGSGGESTGHGSGAPVEAKPGEGSETPPEDSQKAKKGKKEKTDADI